MEQAIIQLVKLLIVGLAWYLAAKSILSKKDDSFFYTLHKGSRLNRLFIFALMTMTMAFVAIFLFVPDLSLFQQWIQYFLGGAGGSGVVQAARKFSPDQKEFVKKMVEESPEVLTDMKPAVESDEPVTKPTKTEDGKLTKAYVMDNGDTVLYMSRSHNFDDRCLGSLSVLKSDSGVVINQVTMENTVRVLNSKDDKVWGSTAIPAGIYELKIHNVVTPMTSRYRAQDRFKNWFTFFIEIANVPKFSNIYFHLGNKPEDTHGCVLTGRLLSGPPSAGTTILESFVAMQDFYKAIFPILEKKKRVFIIIEESF